MAAHEALGAQFPPPRGLSYPAPKPGERGTISPRNVVARRVPGLIPSMPDAHEILDYTGTRHTIAANKADADVAVARRRRVVAAMVTRRKNKGQAITF